ncbi:MAG TPA: TrmJ/YjtD family RNA methyltransferase [Candidatus Lokiarchaeia archaeon]|nr:TrmJ/YjtD family RNA methyltransferase [Candidatus Lokiarchaeia archaeon]
MDSNSRSTESIYVVLVEPEKEGNIGSVARAIKNFGFKHLIIVNPLIEISEEARNYAVHADDVLGDAEIIPYDSEDEASRLVTIQELFKRFDMVVGTTCKIFKDKKRSVHRIPSIIDDFIIDLKNVAGLDQKKIAIVFGKESSGLPNSILMAVDLLVTIPSSTAYASLNLSHAVTVFLYELSKMYDVVGPRGDIDLAPKLQRDVLLEQFDELIQLTRTPSHRVENTSKSFKSVVSRARISRRECFLLLGILRTAVDMIKENEKSSTG